MKTFDPDAKCPKCGHDQVSTMYCADAPVYCPLRYQYPVRAHLDRSCQRCHYRWVEACIDSQEQP